MELQTRAWVQDGMWDVQVVDRLDSRAFSFCNYFMPTQPDRCLYFFSGRNKFSVSDQSLLFDLSVKIYKQNAPKFMT